MSSARAVREIYENGLEFIPESIRSWYEYVSRKQPTHSHAHILTDIHCNAIFAFSAVSPRWTGIIRIGESLRLLRFPSQRLSRESGRSGLDIYSRGGGYA